MYPGEIFLITCYIIENCLCIFAHDSTQDFDVVVKIVSLTFYLSLFVTQIGTKVKSNRGKNE